MKFESKEHPYWKQNYVDSPAPNIYWGYVLVNISRNVYMIFIISLID